MNIALFHFHVTQIKRSAGQSAVAAAAYRAGEKLHSEYYGEISDYTRKGGVICSEILLPSHAPPEYADRETLWNAVEKAERGKKAQLAYSFDIALQNEFSMQENIDLARQFLLDNFVSRGMVTDFAVHQSDKEDGSISNPHFHVMCPIRPIELDGRWGNKQRREYVLDEHGERVLDEAGNYVFNAISTTDWGKPETLEAWRHAWAEMCNAKFAEKGFDCRIDHRSFARQGVEQIPTQHEGPTVRAMEAKGIRTDKGDLNRFIRKTNALLRETKEKITALIGWLKDVKAELAKPQPPMLNDLLALHCANRNKGAYSNKAKNANLQRYYISVKAQYVTPTAVGFLVAICINILLMLYLFLRNAHQIEKAMEPVLNGIRHLSNGNPIHLEETGELAEINASLNKAGDYLLKKDNTRAEWIRGISHDIRTPLSMILGYASEIEETSSLPETTRKQAEIIRRHSEKLKNLVEDLNLTTKLEYSMQPMQKQRLDPVELARQAVSEILNDGLSDKYELELSEDNPGKAITITGDQSLLNRMLCNLIRNCIIHNPDGCRIQVSVGRCDTVCTFSVADNGCGISEMQLNTLNNNKDISSTQKQTGEIEHGLGLKIVRQIVEVHQGTIEYSNTIPHGLTVNFFLPME